MKQFAQDGFCVFDADPRVLEWADAAADVARDMVQDADMRALWLRHQDTWFVGVDALSNAVDGSVSNVPLAGPWEALITQPKHWHRAQVSVVFEGYPKQDVGESDANHRFRINRAAAHVDGILLEDGQRYLREPHSFVLGSPLGDSTASPLVVWPRSHILMRDALRDIIGDKDPKSVDLTEGYKTARASVFAQIDPIEVTVVKGQSVLLHRHMLHGVAPWKATDSAPDEGRMVAYFRPEYPETDRWLSTA